jgi:hypothetical protein
LEDELEQKTRSLREAEFSIKEKEKEFELGLEKMERENKLQVKEMLAEWEER